MLITIFFAFFEYIVMILVLAYLSNIEDLKLVFLYWNSLLRIYLILSVLSCHGLFVALGLRSSIVPFCIVSKFLFDSLKIKIPLKRYLIPFAIGFITTVIIYFQGLSFTSYSLPVSIAMIIPLLEPSFIILHTKR